MRYNRFFEQIQFWGKVYVLVLKCWMKLFPVWLIISNMLSNYFYVWHTFNFADQYWFLYSTKNSLYRNN